MYPYCHISYHCHDYENRSFSIPGTFAQLLPRSLRVTSSNSVIRHGSASAAVKERLEKELDGIKNAGTWKTERVITSRQDVSIDVQGSKGKILNFCANNYLGLSVSKMNDSDSRINRYLQLNDHRKQKYNEYN